VYTKEGVSGIESPGWRRRGDHRGPYPGRRFLRERDIGVSSIRTLLCTHLSAELASRWRYVRGFPLWDRRYQPKTSIGTRQSAIIITGQMVNWRETLSTINGLSSVGVD